MANFEHLIRSAIAAKGAEGSQARAQVYASSRNALQKILAKSPSMAPQAASKQQAQLEAVIARIESEFLQPPAVTAEPPTTETPQLPSEPQPVPAPAEPVGLDQSIDHGAVEPVHEPVSVEPASPAPAEPQTAVPPQSVSESPRIPEAAPTPPPAPPTVQPATPQSPVEQPEPQPVVEVRHEQAPPVSQAPAAPARPKDDPMAELEEILSGGRTPAAQPSVSPEASASSVHVRQDPPIAADYPSDSASQVSTGPQAQLQEPAGIFVEPQLSATHEAETTVSVSQDAPTADLTDMRAEQRPAELPPEFTRRRRSQKRFGWLLVVVLCLGVLALVAFRIFSDFFDTYIASSGNGSVVISDNAARKDTNSDYINILEPGDLTALSVTDNGKVEIVNEQSNEMIRLMSVRDDTDLSTPANPILIRLKPGVIEQVRGKRVTVEIYARSGSGGASQFTVECKFENTIGCGRKRFRVGAQPEASIFAFTMEENQPIDRPALIAINTDITPAASVVGKGDVLDIVYVRLRTFKEE